MIRLSGGGVRQASQEVTSPFASSKFSGTYLVEAIELDTLSCQGKVLSKEFRWKDSYATLGRFDVVDIVEANDPKQIEKAAMIIRAYGHSITETLMATPWREFLATL